MGKNHGIQKRLKEADSDEKRREIIDGLPYQTGRYKPPKHTQFKRGNKMGKGRPRGSEDFNTLFDQALGAKISVTENGKKRQITKKEAIVTQVVNQAASGDPRALKMYLDLLAKTGELKREADESAAPAFDAKDLETFERLLRSVSDDTDSVTQESVE